MFSFPCIRIFTDKIPYNFRQIAVIDWISKNDVFMMFNFFFYMWNISLGFWDAVVDTVTGRGVKWDKTVRFTVQKTEKEAEK